MLNYLRSDVYRSMRNKTLPVALGFFAILVLAMCLFCFCIQHGIFGMTATGQTTVGYSILHMVSGTGFGMALLPILSAIVVIDLVVSDYKAGTLKSILVAPHARRSYVASKAVLAFLLSVGCVAVCVLSFVLLPLVFGVPYGHGTNAIDLALWAGLSTLVCFGYVMIGLFVALLVRRETPVWVLAAMLVWGFLFMIVMGVAGMVAQACPDLNGVVSALPMGLPYTYAQLLANGEAISGLSMQELVLTVVVPLAWAAVAAAGGWLAFRRRTL